MIDLLRLLRLLRRPLARSTDNFLCRRCPWN